MTSRVGRKPITIPGGVEVTFEKNEVHVKGPKGLLKHVVVEGILVKHEGKEVLVSSNEGLPNGKALAGTTRAIINNLVNGVKEGFTKKLLLVGVGYRAQAGKSGKHAKLDLTLGLSHPVTFIAPEGIEIVTPSVTEIIITGIDKHLVGQVAANIRGIKKGIRKPEPYKGKGIRYSDEKIILKETKKK